MLFVSDMSPARDWKGAVPGVTTRQQVLEKFGPAFKEVSKGGDLSNGLTYQGEQAIEGATEADFYFDRNDVLFRIDVFPSREITKEQVQRIFGKDFVERTSQKGFHYLHYVKEGLAVFFEQERDLVHSFIFTPAAPAAKKK